MSDTTSRLNAALEGRYRIEHELGEGGMATVYLAADLRHQRKVALKVLKPELAAVVGAERFLVEIRTTANLQHPHILPLFDSGEADGFLFYVMPYVEGESLRRRLDRQHQLPVEEAVRLAMDVAEALDYAHRHGVIHRDIKPDNVLIHDGQPLVADFGIAFAVTEAGGGRLTGTGLSLGTPHYMSPEQAAGERDPTAATDVYSLGCVLYEMLIGEPPHTAGSAQAVLAKILTADVPAPSGARPSIPRNIDAAIRKALEKLPADRFTTASGFARALADPSFDSPPRTSPGPPASHTSRFWKVAAVFSMLAAVVVAILHFGEPAGTPGPLLRYTMPLPAERGAEGLFFFYRLSPDGRTMAVNGVIEQEAGIFVRDLGTLEWRLLAGTEVGDFFWSPDGRTLAFFSDQKLIRVAADGGPVEEITDIGRGSHLSASGAWGREDVVVFAQPEGGALFRVAATGGVASPVTTVAQGESHRYPAFLPDGRHFLYTSVGGPSPGIYIASLDGDDGRRLLPDPSSAVFAPSLFGRVDGYILFARDGQLVAHPFNTRTLELVGDDAFVLADRALFGDNQALAAAASDNGILAYLGGRNRETDSRLAWMDSLGNVLGTEGLSGRPAPASLSPDRRRAAILRRPPLADYGDVWLRELDRGIETPLTFDRRVHTWGNVVWSPDGSRVVFPSASSGSEAIHVAEVSAPGLDRPLLTGDHPLNPTDWSDDGYLVYSELDPETGADLWYLRVTDADLPAQPVAVRQDPFNTSFGQISPDGRWIAYVSDESGGVNVWVQPFPSGSGRWLVSATEAEAGTTQQPRWIRGGRELAYLTGAGGRGTVTAVPITTPLDPGISPVGRPRSLFDVRVNSFAPWFGTYFFDVTASADRFLVNEVYSDTDPVINVVVNWEALIRDVR